MSGEVRSLTFDEIFAYPGLFPAGSVSAGALTKNMGTSKVKSDSTFNFHSELVDNGLVNREIFEPWRDILHKEALLPIGESGRASIYDKETMIKIDTRIRFCRCLLDLHNLPYDQEEICVTEDCQWQYISLLSQQSIDVCDIEDPLDWLLMLSTLEMYSAPWFAAKCLAHARRAHYLSEQIGETGFQLEAELGLMREWMLFGETWSEAKFIINHSKPTISGKKQCQVLDRHRSSAIEKTKDKAARRQEIVASIVERSSATRGALVREIQKHFKNNYREIGIKVTDRTIRSDLKKVGKTG